MTRPASRIAALRWLVALLPALLCTPLLRHAVESRMPLHMLLEFPLLVASGWSVSTGALRRFDAIDAHGLLGITFAGCVLSFWMIPTALDLSLLDEPARWGKYVSLWSAGLLLRRSRERLGAEVGLFFIGMLVWMLATAGLVYQTMPRRLCVNYLLDEQRWTGVGLVSLAVLLGTLGVGRLLVRQSGDQPASHADRP